MSNTKQMVTTLLDPKLDYIFKNIFGVKKYEHLLISFLNALLKGNPSIKKLVLTNTEFPKIFKDDKASRLDVRATCNDDTEIDIEIQIKNTGEIPERACHYVANMVPGTIGANQSYKAARVIGIWILGENVIDGPDAINEAYMTFQPTVHAPHRIMADTMRVIFVELEKFNPKDADAQDLLTAWLSFLKDPLLLDDVFLKIKDVKDAMDRLKYISSDKEVRANADLRLRTLNDRNSEITVATEKGIAIGEEKGIAIGKEEGITIGKKESAIRMLKKDISLNDISEFTGLSIEDIKSLKK
ncbi:MAG: Rpn family recombination-promoting nuclease/putative transposase [Bacteroidales bacterium]|jgi:predicted transposase/invertase (TIGR01784 family)|nr:Rpn family recombination-promoting nuclease/putative transposase [Bacteroidales bacterium]